MSELFIPSTPAAETTPDRVFWDNILRALNDLASIDASIDVAEDLEYLREMDQAEAYSYMRNFAADTRVYEGKMNDKDNVDAFMVRHGLLEPTKDME